MSDWIKVEDRLPEEGVSVLVSYHGLGPTIAYPIGTKGILQWWHSAGHHAINVTHWQPLPEPPEVK